MTTAEAIQTALSAIENLDHDLWRQCQQDGTGSEGYRAKTGAPSLADAYEALKSTEEARTADRLLEMDLYTH